MSLMKNKNGGELLNFIPIHREEDIDMIKYVLVYSLIVLRYNGKMLLVHDRFKDRWEIPGGKIEQGETSRTCIIRELKEETGQELASIQFEGVIQVYVKDKNQVVYGALYSGRQNEMRAFIENIETSKTIYWDGCSNIWYIDEIDQYLTELV